MGTPGGQRPASSTPPAAAGLILQGMGSNEYKAKLKQLFELAAKWVKEHHRGSNVTQSVLFRLYGLYKRSTVGACNVRQPTLLVEPVARERYNAWRSVTHLSEDIAMREYIDLVRLNFPAFAAQQEDQYKALDDVEMLRRENSHLLKETSSLLHTLRTSQQTSIFKRGHLYRWRTEQIGFAGAKWVRQYVVLVDCTLRLYDRSDAAAPTRTINLQDTVVLAEGTKKKGKFHIFALYPDVDEDEGPANGGAGANGGSKQQELEEGGGFIVRLSTTSESDAEEWMEALTQACLLARAQTLSERDAKAASQRLETETEEEKAVRLRREVSVHLALKRKITLPEGAPSAAPAPVVHNTLSYLPHRLPRPSVLSQDAPEPSYQGFFNLAMSVLGVIFFNNCLDVIRSVFLAARAILFYGARLPLPSLTTRVEDSPFIFGGLEVLGYMLLCWAVELMAARRILPPGGAVVPVLHSIVCCASLLRPCIISWTHPDSPGQGFLLLFFACVTFLKLVSYVHTNWDLRDAYRRKSAEELEAERLEKKGPRYPENLTVADMLYFQLAPTLCYQVSYPRSDAIRLRIVASIILRIIIMTSFFGFIVHTQIQPMAAQAVQCAHDQDYMGLLSGLLHMAIPSTFCWLIIFYAYFHLWLNLAAELLRFGDRAFYKEWWNSVTFGAYWRTWNLPVHQWMVRHLFFPLLRAGVSKFATNVIIFTFSAVLHELLISIPCHVVRFWAFSAMMGQIPLVFIFDQLEKQGFLQNSQAGNFAFWLIFCVLGQPAAVLLYSFDFYMRHDDSP